MQHSGVDDNRPKPDLTLELIHATARIVFVVILIVTCVFYSTSHATVMVVGLGTTIIIIRDTATSEAVQRSGWRRGSVAVSRIHVPDPNDRTVNPHFYVF